MHRHWKGSKGHCVAYLVLKALKHASLLRVSQTSNCANIEVITVINAVIASVFPSNCRGFVQLDLGETAELGINNLSQNVTRMQVHIQAIQSGPMVRDIGCIYCHRMSQIFSEHVVAEVHKLVFKKLDSLIQSHNFALAA